MCLSCKKRQCYICKDDAGNICEHLQSIDRQRQKNKLEQRKLAQQAFAREAKEAQRKARENEAETKALIARTTKRCPKAGCNREIERNGGCGHFTCRKCR